MLHTSRKTSRNPVQRHLHTAALGPRLLPAPAQMRPVVKYIPPHPNQPIAVLCVLYCGTFKSEVPWGLFCVFKYRVCKFPSTAPCLVFCHTQTSSSTLLAKPVQAPSYTCKHYSVLKLPRPLYFTSHMSPQTIRSHVWGKTHSPVHNTTQPLLLRPSRPGATSPHGCAAITGGTCCGTKGKQPAMDERCSPPSWAFLRLSKPSWAWLSGPWGEETVPRLEGGILKWRGALEHSVVVWMTYQPCHLKGLQEKPLCLLSTC